MYNRTGEHKNTKKTVAAGEFKQDDVLVLRRKTDRNSHP